MDAWSPVVELIGETVEPLGRRGLLEEHLIGIRSASVFTVEDVIGPLPDPAAVRAACRHASPS